MFVYHGSEPCPVETSVAQSLCCVQSFQKGDIACHILEGEKINCFTLRQQQAYKGGIWTEFQMTKKIILLVNQMGGTHSLFLNPTGKTCLTSM